MHNGPLFRGPLRLYREVREMKIEFENWPRREIYEFFTGMSNPFYMVSYTEDVAELRAFAHERGISFYYALVYLCTEAMNSVEAFRYAIRGDGVHLLDRRMASFTDLKPGSESFHIVTMPCDGSLEEFCRAAREKSRGAVRFIEPAAETDELIYFSCLPWVELTAMTNERNLDPDDSVPRVSWGRYFESGGRLKLNISLELNHRLLDGLHVGRFHEALRALMEGLN